MNTIYLKKVMLLFCFLFVSSLLIFGDNEPEIRVAKYRGNARSAISYTFDDGLKEHFSLVAPRMHQLGMEGTFWIVGNKVNDMETPDADTTRVSWADLYIMSQQGMEISNHSWSHTKLTKLSLEEVKREIQRNDTAIYEKIGVFPRTFCYPYNAKDEEILKIASADRVATRLKQVGVGGAKSKSTPESLRQMVDKTIENEDWTVAMIHGITYGYDAFDSPDILWNHLEEVSKMKNEVWIGTFRDVATYCEARDAVELKVKKVKKNKYEITPSLSLDKDLFAGNLTLIVELEDVKKIVIEQDRTRVEMLRDIKDEKIMTFPFDPFGKPIYITITDR